MNREENDLPIVDREKEVRDILTLLVNNRGINYEKVSGYYIFDLFKTLQLTAMGIISAYFTPDDWTKMVSCNQKLLSDFVCALMEEYLKTDNLDQSDPEKKPED